MFSHFNNIFDPSCESSENVIQNNSIESMRIDPNATLRRERDDKIIKYFCRLMQLICGTVSFKSDLVNIDVPSPVRTYWRAMVR